MKVAVYGTLKRGYGNNRLLQTSDFIEEIVIDGYKLYNSGFPVARPCENSKIVAEIWDIKNDEHVLYNLDRLEGEGSMYIRTEISDGLWMYVGPEIFWSFDTMQECPVIDEEQKIYEWSR